MDAEREVDLLIAGAGPAGMTAALVASLEGLDVLLCEKSDQVGGTGSTTLDPWKYSEQGRWL
jgi:flavin-dependent dehydrogenase